MAAVVNPPRRAQRCFPLALALVCLGQPGCVRGVGDLPAADLERRAEATPAPERQRGDSRLDLARDGVGSERGDLATVKACPAACNGGCEGGVCIINCVVLTCIGPKVTCPPGMPCSVTCTLAGCSGGVDCTAATSCTIDCKQPAVCSGGIACGKGHCQVSCGAMSCSGGINCSGSCGCAVSCDLLGCVGGVICPEACPTCSVQGGCNHCPS